MNSMIHNSPSSEQYQDHAVRIFRSEIDEDKLEINNTFNLSDYMVKNITLQVTENCNLACTYCYQHCKTANKMNFETAKKFIDTLIHDEDIQNKVGIVLEFIGGEPFLEIDLIDKVSDYYFAEMSKVNLKLAARTRISICSNGVLYFDPRVQAYLEKYKNFISFTISIDGNKELHDSCRIFKGSGEPTYDIAVRGALDYMKRYGKIPTKMTFSKENIKYIYDGITNLYKLGYRDIHCNCAYEPEWNTDDAKIFYEQFKKVADYLIDNNLTKDHYNSMFSLQIGFKKDLENDNNNWCGGNGNMLAGDYQGKWYPCLRYMPSSIGSKQPIIECGDINSGIDHDVLKKMQEVTWTSQSTQECIDCPISMGCSWCSAYNYETYGTINKRVTNICIMHKARSLVNSYFYNKLYIKENIKYRVPVYLPDAEALKIVSEDELSMLKSLANNDLENCSIVGYEGLYHGN